MAKVKYGRNEVGKTKDGTDFKLKKSPKSDYIAKQLQEGKRIFLLPSKMKGAKITEYLLHF